MLRKWYGTRGVWIPVASWSTGPGSICRDLLQENRREDPTGPRHVRAITVAKGFHHHSLFPCDAAKEQNPETGQAREARDPIRQQQCLGDSPQPKCRIHRVSNSPVNSFHHEFMILPHIETDRPIPSERAMRQVKHAQSRNRKEKSQPSEQGMKAVSCETGYRCRYVDERHKSKPCERYEQQRNFHGAASAPYNLFAARTPRVLITYEVPADHQGNENDF